MTIAASVTLRHNKDALTRSRRTSISMESLVRVMAAANVTSAARTIFRPPVTWLIGISYCLI